MDDPVLRQIKSRLDALGWRWADLARALHTDPQRVGNWLRRGVPRAMLPDLASLLGTTVEWLLGANAPAPTMPLGQVYPAVAEGPAVYGRVPLISSVQAGNWREAIDNLHPGDGEDWISTTVPIHAHTYALRVVGDSMEPDFQAGMILIVEPELDPQPGDFVIVKVDGDTTFKQLVQDAGEWYLKPLNPRYPIRPLPAGATFCGVVRESARRHR